jgi:phosphoglycolate phosphatase-like HAD superfamily hydrolase
MEGTLMVKQELLDLMPKVEALIFDIDGVLVDASESYRLAVCEAVKFFTRSSCPVKGLKAGS